MSVNGSSSGIGVVYTLLQNTLLKSARGSARCRAAVRAPVAQDRTTHTLSAWQQAIASGLGLNHMGVSEK